MGGVNCQELLEAASAAGLTVSIKGDRLIVRGPKRFKALVRSLLTNKTQVVQLLGEADTICPNTADGDETPITPHVGQVSSPSGVPDQCATAQGKKSGLIGRSFPPRLTQPPPPFILADPFVLCPQCSSRPVLRELREMTGGLCWPCWAAGTEAKR